MIFLLLAFGLGFVSGLRSMVGPAAVSLATSAGALRTDATWLAFLGYALTPWILTAGAAAELIND